MESLRKARRKHRNSPEGRADHRDQERERRARLRELKRQQELVFPLRQASFILQRVGDQGSQDSNDLANLAAMKPKYTNVIPAFRPKPRFCVICGLIAESDHMGRAFLC